MLRMLLTKIKILIMQTTTRPLNIQRPSHISDHTEIKPLILFRLFLYLYVILINIVELFQDKMQ